MRKLRQEVILIITAYNVYCTFLQAYLLEPIVYLCLLTGFKKYFGIIFLLFVAFYGYGQQLLFTNISNELGLPAQETYNVMQDHKGFIWISTEAGLCRYNGTYCKIFDKKNGLPENSCYAIREDDKGCVWILTSANRVLQYVNDSLREAPFSKNFSAHLLNDLTQAYTLCFVKDSLVINTQHDTYMCGVNSEKVTRLIPDTVYGHYFIKSRDCLNEIKSIENGRQIMKIAHEGKMTLGIKYENQTRQINLNYKSENEPSWRALTAVNKKGESFISFDNKLVLLKPDTGYAVYELPQEIISLYCDKEDGLWVGTLKGGVYYYPDTRSMDNKIVSLEGFSVSGICVDAENGVWCTTLEKGVFYCRNKNVLSFANNKGLDKPAELLKFEGGRLFTSAQNNELIELNKEVISRHELNLMGNKTIADILADEDGWVIAGKNILLKTDKQFSNPVFVKNTGIDFYAGASQLTVVNDRKICGVAYGFIFEIVGNKSMVRKLPLESAGRCIQFIGNNNLLYGCKNGLYELFLDSNQVPQNCKTKKIKGIEGTVIKIFRNSANEIWIATRESGLFVYKGDSVINMTKILKLPTDRLFDITEDRTGALWLGSNMGLICIKRKDGKFNVTVYNTLNGLPSNEIYKVAADSNFIYLSTIEGISRFDLNTDLRNSTPPVVYISSLKVNGKLFLSSGPLLLPYDNNSLKVELDALTFKEINSVTLFYTLKGLHHSILRQETVKGNVISLDNLSPDDYELSIYAVNNSGIKSSIPVVLHFEIQKAFWQSVWFIAGLVFCFGLFVFVLIKQITKRIRNKEEEKTRINKQLTEFQLTALQAQMNPHFIFNAINSIQNYILKKKEQEAYNYLAKFSKLIRMVLNNSEQKTLLLNDELETINLYVELEQLRFKKSFDYQLTIDSSVNVHNVQVPTMLIQPYLENAIWHGLMNLEEEESGKLGLSISIDDSRLKIVIEDNGIGRDQAKQYKKESVHRPIAMKLTEKRLFVINSMDDYAGAKVVIVDLKDENNVASGTRVEIYLPMIEN